MSNAEKARRLEELLAGAQLPALPQSAIRLLELSQDPENGPAEFAVPIEADPGLTGQVLRFVNSSYFGFAREISSVKLAITLVGVRTIKNFALWSAVFSLLPNPKCGELDLKKLWQDSLRRGLFARALGNLLGVKDPEDLFAAGLLQDMAVPLLAKELPDDYARQLEERQGGKQRLSSLEQEQFGWTHADAAARMARGWSLPEEFARLIEVHNQLDSLMQSSEASENELIVSLSSLLPASRDGDWCDRERFDSAFDKIVNGKATAADTFTQIDAEFAEFAPFLNMNTDGKSLLEFYHAAESGAEPATA